MGCSRRDPFGEGSECTNAGGVPRVTKCVAFHVSLASGCLIDEPAKRREEEQRMRLLVAGGAGYVGSALIPRLLERGYLVDVVDLFWFGNNLPSETGLLNKDLFDVTVEDLKDYDQVIFLAGLSNDPMAEFSP